jgi:hypothetical protein
MNEFAPPAGVVVSVCGVEHDYVADAGGARSTGRSDAR